MNNALPISKSRSTYDGDSRYDRLCFQDYCHHRQKLIVFKGEFNIGPSAFPDFGIFPRCRIIQDGLDIGEPWDEKPFPSD